jgi:hypothetical protein
MQPGSPTDPTYPVDADVIVGPEPPAPRRRRLITLLAGGVTLALAAGLGAYVTYQKLFSDGRHPEQFTPASVLAYVAVELDVSLDQRLKLAHLVAKFDQRGETDESMEDLLTTLLERIHLTGVDVKRDLTSWLGRRIALSAWLDEQSRPYALVSATSTDDARARAGLDRVRTTRNDVDLGFVVRDGRAIVAIGGANAQQAANAAAAEAQRAPLDHLASFQEARRWLDAEQLATVWLNLDRLHDATRASAGLDPAMVGLPDDYIGHGTSIMGVRATADGIEARYRTFGAEAKGGAVHDALAQLSALPADTQVGAVMGLPDQPVPQLRSPFGLDGALIALLGGVSGMSRGPAIVEPSAPPSPRIHSEAEIKEIEALLAKDPADLTDAESRRLKELLGFFPNEMPTAPPMSMNDPLAAFAGASVILAVVGLPGHPSVRAVVAAASAGSAADIGRLADGFPDDVVVTVKDATVTIASSDYTAGSGRLADLDAFRAVMAGAPADTAAAVYVDLGSALTASQRERVPVRAIGLVQGMQGSDEIGQLRVIVG